MDKKCTANYQWQDRFKGSQSLEILENRYLRIREEMPRKRRRFGIDVACLASDFPSTNSLPTKWLAAAGGAAAVALPFGYHAAQAADFTQLLYRVPGVILPLLVATVLLIAAWRRRLRGYTLQTRIAGLPLVTIQCPRAADAKALKAFLEKLRPCVEHAEQGRGLSDEALRSGEVRTLRRLANESAISETLYEKAKQQIFSAG